MVRAQIVLAVFAASQPANIAIGELSEHNMFPILSTNSTIQVEFDITTIMRSFFSYLGH